jgi:uncharacterized protein (TIGR02444 family)
VKNEKSEFWAFSRVVYENPAVQQECFCLQDEYDIDVNLLLFCAFIGAVHAAVLSDQDVKDAAGAVGEWHKNVISRLRGVRRALKPLALERSPIASLAAHLRHGVKALELNAERVEQAMLERWSSSRIEAWRRAQPADAIVDNVRTLLTISAKGGLRAELPKHLINAALAAAGR